MDETIYDVVVDGKHFLVERPEGNAIYQWTVEIDGKPAQFLEAVRYRDGGTTYIHTTEGTLYFPSKLRFPDGEPAWRENST